MKNSLDYKHDMAMMLAFHAREAEHAAIDPLLAAIDATLANSTSPVERLSDLTDALATTLNAQPQPHRAVRPRGWS
jgi:hypothetical protein